MDKSPNLRRQTYPVNKLSEAKKFSSTGLALVAHTGSPCAPNRSFVSVAVRPRVAGKFLFVGDNKLYVRGATYGAFRPDKAGQEFRKEVVDRDFAQMAANGLNAVRIPHTTPPRWLLDLAERHGLYVMVGLSGEQYIGYLVDARQDAPDIEAEVRTRVRVCAGHPALLCYALGNEIPAPV